jgi:hypothetical protein
MGDRYQVLMARALLDTQEAAPTEARETCGECHCLECRDRTRTKPPCCTLDKALRFAERVIARDNQKPGRAPAKPEATP